MFLGLLSAYSVVAVFLVCCLFFGVRGFVFVRCCSYVFVFVFVVCLLLDYFLFLECCFDLLVFWLFALFGLVDVVVLFTFFVFD